MEMTFDGNGKQHDFFNPELTLNGAWAG